MTLSSKVKLTLAQKRTLERFSRTGRYASGYSFRHLITLGLIAPDLFDGGYNLTADGRAQLGMTDAE